MLLGGSAMAPREAKTSTPVVMEPAASTTDPVIRPRPPAMVMVPEKTVLPGTVMEHLRGSAWLQLTASLNALDWDWAGSKSASIVYWLPFVDAFM